MAALNELFQSADWKKEKHIPVIEAPDKIKKGEALDIKVSVGKEIAHPNTTEHHIRSIEVYYLAQGEKFPVQIGKAEFGAHGESLQGPNASTIYSQPQAVFSLKIEKPGTILASSYCNIHGLWQNSKELTVE
ncbi:MAG: class II SORL domain-containing protein [Candidatus Omnitrophica bacterium]|nr:class II SORL domain-containing protein [Candidatus Omnitrophota bacterium]